MRENLIGLIRQGNGGYDFNSIELIADYLIANGVTIQHWIPVTERLPEKHTTVLVYRPTMVGKFRVSYFGTNCFCDGDMDIHGNKTITHWMPLPEPPSGERRNND